MLIALLTAWFIYHLGSGAASPLLGDPARLEKAIERQVHDPARLAQLKGLVTELKQADGERQEQRGSAVKAVDEAGARQETTAAELEAAAATLLEGQRPRRDRQLALRLRLAALTTPAEWTAIVGEILPPPPPAAGR
jgi:hypothetical protein